MSAPDSDRPPLLVWRAAIAALFVAVVCAIAYLISPNPPYGFTGELGSTIAGTSTIASFLKGGNDLVDAIGWDWWQDRSAFAFSPMTIYVASVPLAKLFGGNAFEAIKTLQAIELLFAWLSAALLYRCLRGRTRWAIVAGGVYALIPEQLVWARSSVEIGMIFALTPLALAASLALVRRWGAWALPMCGVLASFATAYFDSAYAIFAGLPIVACAAAAAFDRKRPWVWLLMSVASLACGFASVSYTALPTYMSREIFYPKFSLSMLFTSNDSHAAFALGTAWLIIAPTSALAWSLAGVWSVWSARARALSQGEGALLVVGGICALLSLASERFIGVAVAVVAFAATSALQRGAAAAKWRSFAVACGIAGFAGGITLLFVLRNFLGDPIVETHTPSEGRAVGLTWQSRLGPDWELGTAPMPYLAFQRDLAQRYAEDGLGGTGLFGRANVTTIVSASGRAVSRRTLRPPIGYVRSVRPVCIGGGPGLLDRIAALPALEYDAFIHGIFECTRAIYLNSAPSSQITGGLPVETFAGGALFPKAPTITGYDDRIAPERFFIGDAWYRNSIDGDTAEIAGTAVALNQGDTASALFQSDAAPYSLAIHIACHATIHGQVLRDNTFSIPFTCAAQQGFQWLRVPLGKLKPGLHAYRLSITSSGSATSSWSAGLDAVVLQADGPPPKYTYSTAFAFSADRLSSRQWIAPGAYAVTLSSPGGAAKDGALLVDGARVGQFIRFTSQGFHHLRWVGAARATDVVALIPVTWTSHEPSISVSQKTSARWSIVLQRKNSFIEASVFPDGNWFLKRDNGDIIGGARCDLENMCFGFLGPGRYELMHELPPYIVFGFATTLGAWLLAGLILLYGWRRAASAFRIDAIGAPWPPTLSTYLGWLIAIVCTITAINWLRLRELGWMLSWQLVTVGIFTLWSALVAAWISRASRKDEPRRGLWLLWSSVAGTVTCAIASLAIDVADHRLFVLAIALLQTSAVAAIHGNLPRGLKLWLAFVSAITWSLAAGLPFTHLGDWLVNASPSTAWAVGAFVASFALVVYVLRDAPPVEGGVRTRIAVFAIALVVFAAFAFRTDSLGAEWVPLHRSIFGDVAQFVRDGHWLLWDVPSLYGFLSMLTLAIIPATSGMQAVYELTAIVLIVESWVAFRILSFGRAGWAQSTFAIVFPLATLLNDSIARYPMSGRLYPQGGLRFLWVVVLLFIIFFMYVRREDSARVNALRWLGHGTWLIALLWSLEAGAWASAIWVGYLLVEAATHTGSLRERIAFAFQGAWPLVALPVLAWLGIEAFYRQRLGHPPDWRAYIEYTGLFTSGGVRKVFNVQYLGASWVFLIVLASIGSLGIAAIRERRWALLRLLCGAWIAVWATSSYFAVEPLDMYVSLLLGVMVPAAAIAIFASREGLLDHATSLLARYALAPVAIISIALSFGEPSRLAAIRLPLAPGWHFDVLQDAPPISGELADLLQRARIQPGDAVLIPNGDYWTEPQQGLIQPYARDAHGQIVQYHAWLPTSPVGPTILFNALKPDRRREYIDRFLQTSHSGGWFIVYRQALRCGDLSQNLLTVRTLRSPNFAAILCALKQ